MWSYVLPSARPAVYLSQSRLTQRALKPNDFRSAMYAFASWSERLTIIDWGESPTIRKGRPCRSTRYLWVGPLFSGSADPLVLLSVLDLAEIALPMTVKAPSAKTKNSAGSLRPTLLPTDRGRVSCTPRLLVCPRSSSPTRSPRWSRTESESFPPCVPQAGSWSQEWRRRESNPRNIPATLPTGLWLSSPSSGKTARVACCPFLLCVTCRGTPRPA